MIPKELVYIGEKICEVRFLNPVANTEYWHTVIANNERMIILMMKQVLLLDITILPVTSRRLGVKTISDTNID